MSGSNCANRDLLDSPIFIDAVRAHPCLYDCTSQEYKDADLKTRAWEDIARLLGVEGRACKHKWKRLRDYYKTWLEKRNAQETQGGSRRVKTWVHSARMEFLRPFLTTRDCRDRPSSSAHLSQPLFHPYQMDPHLLLQPLPTLQPPPAHQASNTTTTAAAVAAAAAAAGVNHQHHHPNPYHHSPPGSRD